MNRSEVIGDLGRVGWSQLLASAAIRTPCQGWHEIHHRSPVYSACAPLTWPRSGGAGQAQIEASQPLEALSLTHPRSSATRNTPGMNVEDVIETLTGFLQGLNERYPEMADDVQRIEIDLDDEGVLKITTNVSAGWAALR